MNTREAILILLVFVSCRGRARAQGTLVFNGGFATNTDGWILANGAGFEFTKGNPAGDVALGSIPPSDTTDVRCALSNKTAPSTMTPKPKSVGEPPPRSVRYLKS